MRVGVIAYGLDRPFTGIGRYTVEMVRALTTLPDAPELILLTAGDAGPLADLPLQRVPLHGCRLMPALLTHGQAQLRMLAARLRLDVVHDPVGVAPFGLGLGRARSVITIHDVIPLSFPGVSTRMDALIYRRWLPFAARRVDRVLTVSEASSADIQQHLGVKPGRVEVIAPGVSAQFQTAASADAGSVREKYALPDHYILSVGNVEERKNVRRVIEAYAQIRRSNLPYKLVIVGPHNWRFSEIIEAANLSDFRDDVQFTGYVDAADLPAIYRGADVFAFPSLYEGFGLPVIEAMAAGTPAVTSNRSSLPEAAGDAALKVDPEDTDAIADAITRILTDAALADDLRARGIARAAGFTWERMARAVLNSYLGITRG
ncbi:MAG: glycosyltransferase family 4 protein [Anaerolineae bacterium]|nr:glycosyltransferase family 1 protein [Chloroflexota bacterium]MCO6443036.1 glycosyltransferase family 4 protein [Anaerolineae bacterium]MDL1916802.1 glycosyltransferase family 4 protein [Anaerolineae bacterium CFX4]MEB2365471.1 glycosyltransferase family 1 protein [Chloroflexota bacterium]